MAVSSEWIPLLNEARAERKNLWDQIMSEAKNMGNNFPDNIEEIGSLYADLRIDFVRAKQAIDADGDLSSIEIDPRPEDAPEGTYTVLDGYFAHFRLVVDETLKANNITELDLSNPEHSEMFNETEIRLYEAGKSINPLL